MRTSSLTCCLLAAMTLPVSAADKPFTPNISAILNGGYTSRDHDFEGIAGLPTNGEHASGPEEGFWLDHTELALSANIDDMYYGKITTVLDDHDGEIEVELEEAFIQTLALPYGLSIRGGRFMANVGYLNSKHAHTDPFVDRPIANRAFLSTHYYDDGVRVNWIAPLDTYVELGGEAFSGSNFPASSNDDIGATNLYLKTGADIGIEHSWQLGLSWLNTDNHPDGCSVHTHDHGAHDDTHEYEHEEHESVQFCDFEGERDIYTADLIWKWAPSGNYKYQSLTFLAEYFYVDDKGMFHHDEHEEEEHEHEHEGEHHEHEHNNLIDGSSKGWHTSLVYQWSPNWSAGVRYSEVSPNAFYSDENAQAWDVMVQYMRSHFSTIRLQFTHDESMHGVEDDVITLQYTMSLGDHGAHLF